MKKAAEVAIMAGLGHDSALQGQLAAASQLEDLAVPFLFFPSAHRQVSTSAEFLMHMPRKLPVGLQALVLAMTLSAAAAGQTVWSGLTYTFTRPDGVNGSLPEYHDILTEKVTFARVGQAGLTNFGVDEFFDSFSAPPDGSPKGTAWATNVITENIGKAIAASNWSDLTFKSFTNAFGNSIGNFIVGRDAVVHLIDDDIYLDIRFTSWTTGRQDGNPGFELMRAVAPTTTAPSGDYNGDGTVDAADYTVWRDTFGQTVTNLGDGADGDESGEIDLGDYQYWKDRFGQVVSGGGAASIAVPEPAAIALILGGLFVLASVRQRITPRGPGQDG